MTDKAIIVTDLSYGDTGKGATVDFVVRQARSALVVRHNGGGQAAHNVVTPDRKQHVFSHFGSGSFVPGVRTHLSRFMVFEPLSMMAEGQHLEQMGLADIWHRTSVDASCVVVTPWHRSATRLRELARGEARHGSCGYGVADVMADSLRGNDVTLRVSDMASRKTLRAKLRGIRAHKYEQLREELIVPPSPYAEVAWYSFEQDELIDTLVDGYQAFLDKVSVIGAEEFGGLMREHELLVFEGAQGVLLDEWHGFHPYTTWSTTTHRNALELLREQGYTGPTSRLGLIRAYTTRHGAGPFVTEDTRLTAELPDEHNGLGAWQGNFRVGHLDLLAHRYAVEVCGGVDGIVVNGLDRLMTRDDWKYCRRYELQAVRDRYDDVLSFSSDGLVSGLKPGMPNQLERQEHVTHALMSCRPVYESLCESTHSVTRQEWRTASFLRIIEEALGSKVVIASYGPASADRRILGAY